MSCDRFEIWLDDGCPEAAAPEALEHARSCARCARSLEAERAVAALLSSPPTHAPAALAAHVMEEIAALESARLRAAAAPLPWWVMAAADPAVAGALALGALLAWQGRALVAAVTAWLAGAAPRISAWSVALSARLGDALHPAAAEALALALLPALIWLAWRLLGQCERLTVAVAAPRA